LHKQQEVTATKTTVTLQNSEPCVGWPEGGKPPKKQKLENNQENKEKTQTCTIGRTNNSNNNNQPVWMMAGKIYLTLCPSVEVTQAAGKRKQLCKCRGNNQPVCWENETCWVKTTKTTINLCDVTKQKIGGNKTISLQKRTGVQVAGKKENKNC